MHRRSFGSAAPRISAWLATLCLLMVWAGAASAGAAMRVSVSVRPFAANAQQLAFAGLRSAQQQGQFNAIQRDASGNLYLLMDQKDGVRVLKFDPAATTLLAQALLGAKGDIGIALALDSRGNVYVAGTTTSGALVASSGAAFSSYAGGAITSFVARFDSSLNPLFVSFTGGARMAASAIAVSGDAVFVTGSIFGSSLPVTSGGIIQAPPPGTPQNGFVEKFSLDGRSLIYATYLGGQNGYTAPAAIAVDAADDAYIAGYSTATGFPTIGALVPELIPTPSLNGPQQQAGFLTKLTPAGDGLAFSTFISGSGVTSVALDPSGQYLYLSGGIAPGQFPLTGFALPIVDTLQTTYQTLVKMTVDGATVLSSIALAPGGSSTLARDASGNVWVAGALTGDLLPLNTLADVGNGYAIRVNQQGQVDEALRFGGIPTSNLGFTTADVNLTSLATDSTGNVLVAGSFQPTADSSQVATQQYELPLEGSPTSALPSTVRDLVPSAASCGNTSQCAGSGGYLAKVNVPTGLGDSALSLSADGLPNLTLRNLGSSEATSVQLSATGYTLASDCGTAIAAGGECGITLIGTGPGSLSAQSATQTFTVPLPANASNLIADPILFSPREIDFGLQSATRNAATRTITVTNVTGQTQTFTSMLDTLGQAATSYKFAETESDCGSGATSGQHVLAANAACHVTVGFTASSNADDDGFVKARWLIGSRDVLLTGYTQAAGITVSSAEVDFGTQIAGGLRLPRYFYISNHSGASISHAALSASAGSPFTVTDRCPDELLPETICQVQVDYLSAGAPSADSTVLTLDAGLSVLVTGQTLPQPAASGATPNPNLSVTPAQIAFADPVAVTTTSNGAQQVQISNTGSGSFSLALGITGDFNFTSTCPASLPGGASCAASITFSPSQAGLREGLLSVAASGGSAVYVALSGAGITILSASPTSNGTLDFGSVPVGEPEVQWLKLGQAFTALTATASAHYGVVIVEEEGYGHGQPPATDFQPNVTSACANCWLGVQFLPAAEGVQAGTLQLASSAAGNPYVLALTGNGLSLNGPYLTPASVDFGPVPLNSSSGTQSFSLTNGGTQSITLSTPATTGDFSVGSTSCAAALAAGNSCSVSVVFAPASTGPRTGALAISVSQSGSQTGNPTGSPTGLSVMLSGYGSADPGVALNPLSLTFNNVPNPSATVQTVTVTNTSASTVQVGTPTTGTAQFAAGSQCATLAPSSGTGASASSSCTIQVNYTPGTTLASDTLLIPVTTPGQGGAPPTTAFSTVALAGAYSAEDAGLSITPTAMDYGPSPSMTPGGIRAFTITNLTAKTVALTLTPPRQFALISPPCGSLGPHASCQVSLQFVPLANGAITGSLLVLGDPGDNSGMLNGLLYLQGYGDGGSSLAISGSQQNAGIVDFGTVASGQSSQRLLTLTNNSAGPLNVRRITSEPPFISVSNCEIPLPSGGSCAVTLTFAPVYQYASASAPPAPQQQTGTIVVESDSVTGPDILDLTGMAQPVPSQSPNNSNPLASFSLSQNSLVFPATPVGDSAAAQTVNISNTGTATIHIAEILAGPDFPVDKGACIAALAPSQSCTFTVAFNPQNAGPRIGAVEIASDNSTGLEFVSLFGTAPPPALAISPARLGFGTVAIGSTAQLPLQISNTGSSPVTLTGITVSGDYAQTGNCPANGSLAAGANCALQVAFTPSATGSRTGTLSVANSATTQPLTVVLIGTGAQSQLQSGASSLNFGAVPLGQSAVLTLALINNGTAPVTNLQPTIIATSDFAVSTGCPTTTLAPGSSCLLAITFTPTAVASRSATLSIVSSDPRSPLQVPLQGTGLQTGSFTLTASGNSSLSATATQGQTATYQLALTPTNGFQGVVVLGCAPQVSDPAVYCSVLPASIALSSGAVSTTVTINTVTGTMASIAGPHIEPAKGRPTGEFSYKLILLCAMFPFGFLLLARTKKTEAKQSARVPRLLLWLLAFAFAAGATQGCGSGNNPNLHFGAPGNYPFLVTATSTNGLQITQTVTLKLTITAQ